MDLKDVARNWEAFAREDPLWAILTSPGKDGKRWSREEFFARGRDEIDGVMEQASALGSPGRRDRALDFGCGVGRLTQALCRHFARCDGVDISPTMIEQARAWNAHGERCAYHRNDRSDLALFPDASFDFIYSNIVLQHVAPRDAVRYVGELVRVLRPDGLLVFQLPERMRMPWRLFRPASLLRTRLRSRGSRPVMEMHGVPSRRIGGAVAAAGGRILRRDEDGAAGPMWRSLRYWVTRT